MTESSVYRMTYAGYAEALRQALVEDPFYIAIEQSMGGGEAGRQALLRYLDFSIVEAERYGVSFFPDGDAVGVSVWSKPLSVEQAQQQKLQKQQFLTEQLSRVYYQLYQEITGFMSEQAKGLVDENAWYLSILGVLPEFQNRGLGVGLISEVLQQTDALAVPTFLETFTPRNESFYQRLGYRVVARPFEPSLQASYAIMLRDSAASPEMD